MSDTPKPMDPDRLARYRESNWVDHDDNAAVLADRDNQATRADKLDAELAHLRETAKALTAALSKESDDGTIHSAVDFSSWGKWELGGYLLKLLRYLNA